VGTDAAQQGAGGSALEITLERSGDGAILRLTGELDLASAPAFERELAAAEKKAPDPLAIDLRELGFIDSSGLRLLLLAAERARAEERRLVVVKGSPEVDRVLEITGADRQLELVPEPPEL
jgi:anti-sigma B factor antagonist